MVASHADLEGSDTHLDPLEGEDGAQAKISHQEVKVKVKATKGRDWHFHIIMKSHVILDLSHDS